TPMTEVIARPQKSTIVRSYVSPPPIRAAFWFLERVAPGVGARWAERIWFRLPRPPSSTRATTDAGAASGKRFAVKSDGARIAVETWGEGTPVYLAHGWAGRRGQLSALIDPLVARGHRVVAFDAPSHGDSSPGVRGPRSSSIPEFANALWAVVVRFGSPHAVIAHSMGATATAVALCDGLVAER